MDTISQNNHTSSSGLILYLFWCLWKLHLYMADLLYANQTKTQNELL